MDIDTKPNIHTQVKTEVKTEVPAGCTSSASNTSNVVSFKTKEGYLREVPSLYVRIHPAAHPIVCDETAKTIDDWINYVATQQVLPPEVNDKPHAANLGYITMARFHAAYGIPDQSLQLCESVSVFLGSNLVSPFVAYGVGAHLNDVDLCALAVSHPSELIDKGHTCAYSAVGPCYWYNYHGDDDHTHPQAKDVPFAKPGGTLDPQAFGAIYWSLLPTMYIWLLVRARQCPPQGAEIGEAFKTMCNVHLVR